MRRLTRVLGRRGRTLRRNERGVEVIEFALVSIFLFMLVFGIMEFGRAIWIYGTVAHVAREGTRFAIVRGSESGRTWWTNGWRKAEERRKDERVAAQNSLCGGAAFRDELGSGPGLLGLGTE